MASFSSQGRALTRLLVLVISAGQWVTSCKGDIGENEAVLGIQDGSSLDPLERRGADNLAIEPGTLRFSETRMGESSSPQRVVVTSQAEVPIFLAVSVSDESQFQISNTTCNSSEPFDPSAVCEVEIAFNPKEHGAVSDNLVIGFSSVNHTFPFQKSVNLVGSGFDPSQVEVGNSALSIDPATYDFGFAKAFSGTKTAELEVTNDNASGRVVYIGQLAGSNTHFQITDHDCPISPAAFNFGSSCTVSLRFAPQTAGELGASLQVKYGLAADSAEALVSTAGLNGVGVGDLNFDGLDSVDNITTTSARINWTHDTNAANYFIFEIQGGSPVLVDTVPSPTSTYDLTGLDDNTSYTYRVRAQDGLGTVETNTTDETFTTLIGPALNAIGDKVFPGDYLDGGATLNVDINNEAVGGTDANMDYSCVFDRTIDDSVSAGTDCTSLPGAVTFNTSTGELAWTPPLSTDSSLVNSFGPYEVKVIGDDRGATDDEVFVVSLRRNYSITNLLLALDPAFAMGSSPGVNAPQTTTMENLFASGTDYDADLVGTFSTGWAGDGSLDDPYHLNFDRGDSTRLDLGGAINTDLAGLDTFYFEMWINPDDISETGARLLENGGVSNEGLSLKVSDTTSGQLELHVGDTETGTYYADNVLEDNPVAYWRLNESAGTTADSLGSLGATVDGTYVNGYTLGATGLETNNSGNKAVDFDGIDGGMEIPGDDAINTTDFDEKTIELWFNADNVVDQQVLYEQGGSTNGANVYLEANSLHGCFWTSGWSPYIVCASETVLINTTYHVVATFKRDDEVRLYLNGVEVDSAVTEDKALKSHGGEIGLGFMRDNSYFLDGADSGPSTHYFDGVIDELSLYSQSLTADRVAAHYSGARVCAADTMLRNDVWQLVTGSFDGTTAKLFVNRSEVCSVDYSGGVSSAESNLTFGSAADGSDAWSGKLGSLKFYSAPPSGVASTSSDAFYTATKGRYLGEVPPTIANLVLWLKADELSGLGNGDPIATWPDSSDEDNDSGQSDPDARPLYVANAINGQPAVSFDGDDDYFLGGATGISGNEAATVIFVAVSDDEQGTASDHSVFEVGALGGGSGTQRRYTAESGAGVRFNDGNRLFDDGFDSGTWKMAVFSSPEGATYGDFDLWINGTARAQDDSRTNTGNLNRSPNTTDEVYRIGARADTGGGIGEFFTGDVAEVIVYDRALTTVERESLEEYLSDKYGISTP